MAADSFSAVLGLLLMGTGNDNNAWGSNANAQVFQIIEDAVAGTLTSAVSGGTLDLSGTPPPNGPSQARYSTLIFTGTLTSNQTVKVPNLTKFWWVANLTSGAFTLTIQTPTPGATVVIPQQASFWRVNCNGANGMHMAPQGDVQNQMPDGAASVPPYSNVNETNSGLYRAGSQDWRFAINGTDVLQLTGPSAGTPSVANFLSPLSLQQAGVQVIPPGIELSYAGVNLPAGFLWCNGQAVSRTTYANLLGALRASFTGTTSNGSPTITSVGTDLRNLGLEGAVLEGNGVAGLTISSLTSSTITLSGNASASNTITIFAYPYGRGDGSTTFNVPDRRGRVIAGRDNMGNAGDAAAGRLTTGGSGVNGIELTAAGGAETRGIAQTNLPNVNFTISGITLNDPQHNHLGNVHNSNGPNTHPSGQFPGQVIGAGISIYSGTSDGSSTFNSGFISNASTGITVSSQGTAASGGSGTNLNVTQATGVSNYIIKY